MRHVATVAPRLIYDCPTSWPQNLKSLFVSLGDLTGGPCQAASEFLRSAPRASLCQTLLHRTLCCMPLDDFDINARLDIYPLHIFSQEQLERLLRTACEIPVFNSVLDVGAGSGKVTSQLHPFCRSLLVSETSAGMAEQLNQQGYQVWQEDIAQTAATRRAEGYEFAMISILNVLDRCASPKSLLTAAHTLLGPSPSLLLLATPLPFRGAYFGWGTYWSGCQMETLGLESGTEDWAQQAQVLLEEVLPAAGFEPVAITRLPYICAGDAFVPFSALDDLVVVARKHEYFLFRMTSGQDE
eukprot:TRINITY_DN41834_c0_g1_i1.p1 TRINITY_DN41834_c0_g1~~TRINITY_DN41834_c0_g1_i1.p1  ORF type:complete len:338 (+),score=36.73 TRINITY_DN41834_c0_g1_i1:123-1016(+)